MDRLEIHIDRKRKQLELAEGMKSIQETTKDLTDLELMARNNSVNLYKDPVYQKLQQVEYMGIGGSIGGNPTEFIGAVLAYTKPLMTKMEKRKMTEEEYNYILQTPAEEIFRKIYEPAQRERELAWSRK